MQALAEKEAALSERAAAIEAALAEREAALAEREALVAEREASLPIPPLPHGQSQHYQVHPPHGKLGPSLVGRCVLVYFSSSDEWYDGVVVRYQPDEACREYVVYYPADAMHEEVGLPDAGIHFRKASHPEGATVEVTTAMLPSD